MANRIKELFERIVYAGMTPGGRAARPKRGFLAGLLAGPDPSDPLYLTKQTAGQKLKRGLLLASPVIVVAVVLFAVLYRAPQQQTARQPTTAEVLAKTLPDFNQEIKLETNRDVEVTDVHFEPGVMVGNLRNTTNHPIVEAVVTFELADSHDSTLGGVTVTEINLAAGSTRPFRKPIEQSNAVSALVRDVETK